MKYPDRADYNSPESYDAAVRGHMNGEAEAEICRKRGHSQQPTMKWKKCKWCGLWFRNEKKVVESETAPPPDPDDEDDADPDDGEPNVQPAPPSDPPAS